VSLYADFTYIIVSRKFHKNFLFQQRKAKFAKRVLPH
jgi:hypothetical protein